MLTGQMLLEWEKARAEAKIEACVACKEAITVEGITPLCHIFAKDNLGVGELRVAKLGVLTDDRWVVLLSKRLDLLKVSLLIEHFAAVQDRIES